MANEAERGLEDLAKWWAYNHSKSMDPLQFVDFQDKYDQAVVRLFADMLERIQELEKRLPKIVLPTGLKLNDPVRTQ